MQRSFLRDTIRKTKSDAKLRRNLDFNIDIEYLMEIYEKQNGKCALSGWDLEFTRGGNFAGNKNPKGCTLDRIDNSLGYVKGNIQLACTLLNYKKSDMLDAEFRAMCKDVSDHS